MALSYTRLLCRRGFDIRNLRSIYTTGPRGIVASAAKCSAVAVNESYDEKNARLKRPMSPHLTIYKFQLTAVMSITHRATGMILAGYGMIFGLGTLFIPGGVASLIASIDALCLPGAVLFLAKYFLALPATYHYFNGIRHLTWDLGKCLTIKQVYSTGYTVAALTILSAIGLAAFF